MEWEQLRTKLVDLIGDVASADQTLGSGILILQTPYNRFIQYSRWLGEGVACEVAGPEHVELAYTEAALSSLFALGFEEPCEASGGNYWGWYGLAESDVALAAEKAVAVIRDVLEARSPEVRVESEGAPTSPQGLAEPAATLGVSLLTRDST